MDQETAKEVIDKLLEDLQELTAAEKYHKEFGAWREKAIRRVSEIFGKDSLQVASLKKIKIIPPSMTSFRLYGENAFSKMGIAEVVQRFISLMDSLLEELPDETKSDKTAPWNSLKLKRVFISHSSKDTYFGKEITNLMELIGVPSNQIFNSSMPGFGVKPGEDWVETLKTTISSDGVVISLLSDRYYKSPVSLCEMGATWVLSKTHYPVLIPPFTFRRIKGVIPTKHGIMINDSEGWSTLKEELEKIFGIQPISVAKWEGKKKDILERIEKLLPSK